ncbi:MAG: mRNA surveillance protein pelota [Candidatus Diapherotrites archaeon]
MKILKINKEENFFEVIPSGINDLWMLEKIISEGDLVSGQTERKFKPSKEGEKTIKKNLLLEIKAEKISFHIESASLRVLGEVTGGKPEELVELKSHHTIEIETGKKTRVKKEKLLDYHIDLLEQAKKSSQKEKILALILDDEGAEIYSISDYGAELKAEINAGKQGKRFKTDSNELNYFKEITDKLIQLNASKIVFAGPGFTKENLEKYIENKRIELHYVPESINSVGKQGLNELIKTGKLASVEKELKLKKEMDAVDELITEISKNGKAEYGLKEVKKAIESGAGKKLLVLDELLLENRKEMEKLIDRASKTKTQIIIISKKSDAGKQLNGLSGIGIILRYKVN